MKVHPRLFVLAALAVVLLGGPLFAADHGTPTDTLKKSLTRYDLGIWTLVVFSLLFFILAKFAWPQIIAGLDLRQAKIEEAFKEAAAARAEAAAARAELITELAKANMGVKALLDEARRDADALRATEKAAGIADAKAEREKAKTEIEVAKDQALAEIYTYAVQLATQISGKVLARQVSQDDHARLLDEAIAELSSTVSHTKPVSA